jgi:DNA (cytosine-5)-methyltransferase 1
VSEIDGYPSRVLAHHYPDVPNLGDMRGLEALVRAGQVEAPDVLVGGTPCQAFALSGLRGGLEDARGNLALAFVRLANAVDDRRSALGLPPAWIVWENVVGVLSMPDAFGSILAGLVGCDDAVPSPGGSFSDAGLVRGPNRCAAWRVLDAQHFGLAQRRSRTYLVARGGDRAWGAADALVPIVPCSAWHPAPRREPRESSSGPVSGSARGGGRVLAFGGNNTAAPLEVAASLQAHPGPHGRQDFETDTFLVVSAPAVRRLSVLECERLMGFPDGYTDVGGAKDGPRYKALGNSMAVPVVGYVGERIEAVLKGEV